MSDALKLDINGPIATLTMTRPKAFNSFNEDMRISFREAIEEIDANPDIRVVVLNGEGPGFCAGADLKEGFPDDVQLQLEKDYRPSLEGIGASPKIWIAQVHGSAAGIGAAFAMNCDLMVMAESAKLYMAFGAIGLVPDGSNSFMLMQGMGYRRAMKAILTGEMITAQQCLDYGLTNAVVADDALAAETQALAEQIAATAPLAAKEVKSILRSVQAEKWGEVFSHEASAQGKLIKTEDSKEGVAAFIAKRPAVFKGR